MSNRKIIPVYYDGVKVGEHRLDLYVESQIIVELKTVETFGKIHFAIVKSYLRATNHEVALLLNYKSPTLEIKRIVQTINHTH